MTTMHPTQKVWTDLLYPVAIPLPHNLCVGLCSAFIELPGSLCVPSAAGPFSMDWNHHNSL